MPGRNNSPATALAAVSIMWPTFCIVRDGGSGNYGCLADYLTRVDFVILDQLDYLPFARSWGQPFQRRPDRNHSECGPGIGNGMKVLVHRRIHYTK